MNREEQERINRNLSGHKFRRKYEEEQRNYIAAIDIGTTKIVAIIGHVLDDGRLEILGKGQTSSQGVKRGMVQNIEETAAAIKKAVEIAEQESRLSFKEVYVGIAGQHIRSFKNNTSKNITATDHEITQQDVDDLDNDMRNIVLENGEKIVHILPQIYIVDNDKYVKNPVGMFGRRLEANYHIIVGETIAEKYIRRSIERAGLVVKKLILEPLASASAVVTEDEKEVGIAMIDIGGGTTDIAIFHDGTIRHTAVVPLGGDVITNDIKQSLKILERDAERLKIENGMAIGEAAPENEMVTVPGISGRAPRTFNVRFLSRIIQSRMEDIIGYASYQIETSGYLDKLGAGIKVTGGGSMLTYLKELLAYKTGLDVHIGYPNLTLTENSIDASLPTFATSVGLLLRGYEIDKRERIEAAKLAKIKEEEDRKAEEERRRLEEEEAKKRAEREKAEREAAKVAEAAELEAEEKKKHEEKIPKKLQNFLDKIFNTIEDKGEKM